MKAKQRSESVRREIALLTDKRIGEKLQTLCLERSERVPFVDELIEALITQGDQRRSGTGQVQKIDL